MLVVIGLAAIAVGLSPLLAEDADTRPFTDEFAVDAKDLASTGINPYFVLEPGYVLVLEGKEDGKDVKLTITVLDETKKVGDVETRVVEEREVSGDKELEVSRNYFAISKRTNSVYYFGEDGGGSWLSGEKGAKFGMMMPGTVLVGSRYYQEQAPGAAMDRAENVSLKESLETPAGKFDHVLKVEETTPLEPDEKSYKYYAAGVGLLKDGGLSLVKYGKK
jgi:hypothetical protein